jgi:hypothetical protein
MAALIAGLVGGLVIGKLKHKKKATVTADEVNALQGAVRTPMPKTRATRKSYSTTRKSYGAQLMGGYSAPRRGRSSGPVSPNVLLYKDPLTSVEKAQQRAMASNPLPGQTHRQAMSMARKQLYQTKGIVSSRSRKYA